MKKIHESFKLQNQIIISNSFVSTWRSAFDLWCELVGWKLPKRQISGELSGTKAKSLDSATLKCFSTQNRLSWAKKNRRRKIFPPPHECLSGSQKKLFFVTKCEFWELSEEEEKWWKNDLLASLRVFVWEILTRGHFRNSNFALVVVRGKFSSRTRSVGCRKVLVAVFICEKS